MRNQYNINNKGKKSKTSSAKPQYGEFPPGRTPMPMAQPKPKDLTAEARKWVDEHLDDSAMRQIRNSARTIRLANGEDKSLAEVVSRYQQAYGRAVPGKPESESDMQAYTDYGRLPNPASPRLGQGKHNRNFYDGLHTGVGGVLMGAASIGSPLIRDAVASSSHGKELARLVGKYFFKFPPMSYSGLSADTPQEQITNIAKLPLGAFSNTPKKQAISSLVQTLIPVVQRTKMGQAAKALGYKGLDHFIAAHPEAKPIRDWIVKAINANESGD